jgi:hypothetical protein
MGRKTPVYRWFFLYAPFFDSVRIPVRWLELWFLMAALLAGLSFEGLQAQVGKMPSKVLLATLLLLALMCGGVALWLFTTDPGSPLWLRTAQWNATRTAQESQIIAAQLRHAALASAGFGALGLALACLVAGGWNKASPIHQPLWQRAFVIVALSPSLFFFWRSLSPVSAEKGTSWGKWPQSVTDRFEAGERWETNFSGRYSDYAWNNGLPAGIDIFNGYDPFGPRRLFEFAGAFEGRGFFSYQYQVSHRPPLLRVAGVTHTLSAEENKGWMLSQRNGAWPRVYLTNRVLALPESAQLPALQQLANADFQAQGKPVVVASDVMPDIALGLRGGTITRWTRSSNRWDIDLQTTAPTALVVGDSHYPGWRAYVTRMVENEPKNRQTTQASIVYANFLFRGVALPAGARHVTMVYEPQTFRVALFLSLAGLAGLCAIISFQLHKGKS